MEPCAFRTESCARRASTYIPKCYLVSVRGYPLYGTFCLASSAVRNGIKYGTVTFWWWWYEGCRANFAKDGTSIRFARACCIPDMDGISCRSSTPNDARLRHSVRHRSLEKAKLELDSEVHDLNKVVKRLRFSKSWLDKRERKIGDFEALLEAGACCSEPKPEQDTSSAPTSDAPHLSPESSSATGKLRSLEVMLQVSSWRLPVRK